MTLLRTYWREIVVVACIIAMWWWASWYDAATLDLWQIKQDMRDRHSGEQTMQGEQGSRP